VKLNTNLLFGIIRLILFPFSILYGIITLIRNRLFDWGIFKSKIIPVPSIGIGNLSTGGTGKTPISAYLIELLVQKSFKVAYLSRGYGRKSKGVILADEHHSSPDNIGDEPTQIFNKFNAAGLIVCVAENRNLGIEAILAKFPNTEVIILDDCFQHRWVKVGLMIALNNFHHPYYNDHLLPSGNLREYKSGIKRADIIITTKTPIKNSSKQISQISNRIRLNGHQPLFFTGIRYNENVFDSKGHPVAINTLSKSLIVSGIANNQLFFDEALKIESVKESKILSFADHHTYTAENIKDFERIVQDFGLTSILTTEKDFQKISILSTNNNIPIYYWPIQVKFLDSLEEDKFQSLILKHVSHGL